MKVLYFSRRVIALLWIILSLGACAAAKGPQNGDILVIGDSILAWNADTNQSIPDALAVTLQRDVVSRAVPGAQFANGSAFLSGLGYDIRAQYGGGRWNWIVVNGGANDLGFNDCNCGDCSAAVNRLISDDGRRGQSPAFLDKVQTSGAKILWMGYYTSPGETFEGCGDDLVELEQRVIQYLDRSAQGYFMDARGLIDTEDPRLFAQDDTHPSPRSSAILGTALGEVIRQVEARSKIR